VKDLAKPVKCGLCRFCGAVMRLDIRQLGCVGLCACSWSPTARSCVRTRFNRIGRRAGRSCGWLATGRQFHGRRTPSAPLGEIPTTRDVNATTIDRHFEPLSGFLLVQNGYRWSSVRQAGVSLVARRYAKCSLERCRGGSGQRSSKCSLPKMSIDGQST
jgi:hypothetical protein